MLKTTWKLAERVVATFFNTTRNPLSSQYSRHDTTSDTLHPRLYIEVKRDKKFFGKAICDLIEDTNIKAKNEKKIPVICLKQHNKRGFYLLVHCDNLLDIANEVEES